MNRLSRTLVSSTLRRPILPQQCRQLHLTLPRRNTALNNILAGGPAPAVQIKTITSEGIQLADGLTIPSACIFLEGKTYLWDVPQTLWDGWKNEHFDIFDVVVPKPGKPLSTVSFSGTHHQHPCRNTTLRHWKEDCTPTSSFTPTPH